VNIAHSQGRFRRLFATKKTMSSSDDEQFNDTFTPAHPAKKLHTINNSSDDPVNSQQQFSEPYHQNHHDGGASLQDRNLTQSLSDVTLSTDPATATSTNSPDAKFWQITKSLSSPFNRKAKKKLPNQQTDISTNDFQLWSCANCLQVNKVGSITCGRCQLSYGSTAAGQCFCSSCKLKVFVPASTDMVNTVCPCCEKALDVVPMPS